MVRTQAHHRLQIFAVAYIITAAVASFFPTSPVDLTPAGMVSHPYLIHDIGSMQADARLHQNWSSVMFSGVAFIAIADYLIRGRKHYVPPVRHVHKM